jgi:hypothetical protein
MEQQGMGGVSHQEHPWLCHPSQYTELHSVAAVAGSSQNPWSLELETPLRHGSFPVKLSLAFHFLEGLLCCGKVRLTGNGTKHAAFFEFHFDDSFFLG